MEYNQMPNIIVNESTAELKRLAKMALRGLWQKAIIGVIIYYAFISLVPGLIALLVPGLSQTYNVTDYITDQALLNSLKQSGINYTVTVSQFPSLYQAFLTGPFLIGFTKYLLMIVRRREINNGLLFKGFENFGKSFLLQVLVSLLSMLWCLPFVILMSVGGVTGLPFLMGIGLIGTIVMAIWAMIRYTMSSYYLSDDMNLKPMEAIRLSATRMKGNIGNFIYLVITFVGWYLLASLISGIIVGPFAQMNITTGFIGVIVNFVTNIPLFFVYLYFGITKTFYYEILSGHLVRQSSQMPNYQGFPQQ